VDRVFSGHWHANRTRRVDGLVDYNTTPLRYAGIDRSDRGFRVVDLADGLVRTQVRVGGIESHLRIVHPAAGSTVPFGAVELRASAYDTRHPALDLTYQLSSDGGQLWTGTLAAAGGWSFASTADETALPSGHYTLTVDVSAMGDWMTSATVDFDVAAMSLPASIEGQSWPGLHGDASGTGIAGGELTLPLATAWITHVGGPTNLSSPVYAGGRVFVAHAEDGDTAAALVAFEAASGDELWRVATPGDVKGTPAVAGEWVVVVTADGTVLAVNAATGSERWRTQLGDAAVRFDLSSPTIVDDVVYVGGSTVSAALALDDGSAYWQVQPASSDWLATIYSAPAVDDERVVVAVYSGLHVLDRSSGATRWSRATGRSETHRSAALAGGVLYAAGDTFGSQRLRALDIDTGAELWSASATVGNANSAPGVTASAVVIGTSHGVVQAFDRQDGSQLWSYWIGEAISSGAPYQRARSTATGSPLVLGSSVIIGGDDGALHVISASDGARLDRIELGAPVRSSAAASGNRIWVTTIDGQLVCLVAGTPREIGVVDPGTAPALVLGLGVAEPHPLPGAGWIPFVVGVPSAARTAADAATAGPLAAQRVRLTVHDVTGRRVCALVDGSLTAGDHRVRWDGRDARGREVATGVYFLRLESGSAVETGRVVLVR
jgi:outer membrane protein assembly factor BamB